MGLRIVSWNIQKGIGMDARPDLARTADTLASFDPDVVGLQEVIRAKGNDQAALLADRTGLRLAWGPARPTRRGEYGNALLVRGEVDLSRVHDLSVGRREPRVCLEALVRVRGQRLRIIVCHFGLNGAERRAQAERLRAILRAAPKDVPRVVMGDFNEWREGPVGEVLASELQHCPARRPTHPSVYPLLSLDRMAWDGALEGRLRVLPVHFASDHRALEASLFAEVQDTGVS
jgi:endonuclease/exonuclease/phosphatase family metal-dependent hydrolase